MKKKEKNLTNFVQIKERIMVYKELFIHRGQIIKPDEEQTKRRKIFGREQKEGYCHALLMSHTCQI